MLLRVLIIAVALFFVNAQLTADEANKNPSVDHYQFQGYATDIGGNPIFMPQRGPASFDTKARTYDYNRSFHTPYISDPGSNFLTSESNTADLGYNPNEPPGIPSAYRYGSPFNKDDLNNPFNSGNVAVIIVWAAANVVDLF